VKNAESFCARSTRLACRPDFRADPAGQQRPRGFHPAFLFSFVVVDSRSPAATSAPTASPSVRPMAALPPTLATVHVTVASSNDAPAARSVIASDDAGPTKRRTIRQIFGAARRSVSMRQLAASNAARRRSRSSRDGRGAPRSFCDRLGSWRPGWARRGGDVVRDEGPRRSQRRAVPRGSARSRILAGAEDAIEPQKSKEPAPATAISMRHHRREGDSSRRGLRSSTSPRQGFS
jgi:hypothetical protein